MIKRTLSERLASLFEQYPFVTVTGPRQSGKTTLCRALFPHLDYINFEQLHQREFAIADPIGFLAKYEKGAILDEVQRVPGLLSELMVFADEKRRNGLFVLTGSEHFALSKSISQSLAGRSGMVRLLPLSLEELQQTGASEAMQDLLYSGFYPRIYDQSIEPRQLLSDYIDTFVERDVHRLGEIRRLENFRQFVRLCAGRIGTLINLSQLGADAGVSRTAAEHWLNLLESGFIVFRLPPYFTNIRKRLVKSHKLYFYDVGLASYLLGINHPDQVFTHPMRGFLFENMVVVEAFKHSFNMSRNPRVYFYRDSQGLECDLLYESGTELIAIEVKAGTNIASDWFKPLHMIEQAIPNVSKKIVVYGGNIAHRRRSQGEYIPVGELSGVLEQFEAEQALASFGQNYKAPPPKLSDVETLDKVYRIYIRQTLDEVESSLIRRVEQHFRQFSDGSILRLGPITTRSTDLLKLNQWEITKADRIVKKGFNFSDRRELELKHEFRFSDYIHGEGVAFTITLAWSFNGTGVSQFVSINNSRIEELDRRILYKNLDSQSTRIHATCARILESIIQSLRSIAENFNFDETTR